MASTRNANPHRFYTRDAHLPTPVRKQNSLALQGSSKTVPRTVICGMTDLSLFEIPHGKEPDAGTGFLAIGFLHNGSVLSTHTIYVKQDTWFI